MSESKRPSYFPSKTSYIPPSLKEEEKFWSLDPELVLSEDSSFEMLRSHQLMEGLLHSGLLERLGLSQKLIGFNTLKAHETRVAILSLLINQELKRRRCQLVADTRILASSALFHDMGKLEPEIHDVVMYPGVIGKDQKSAWDAIKRHPDVGHNVVHAMLEFSQDERLRVAEAVYKHHERKDGTGYHHIPFPNIPPEAQIISVADAMDVMMGKRPYREPSTTEQVIAELDRCSDQFNPEISVVIKNLLPSSGDFIRYAA